MNRAATPPRDVLDVFGDVRDATAAVTTLSRLVWQESIGDGGGAQYDIPGRFLLNTRRLAETARDEPALRRPDIVPGEDDGPDDLRYRIHAILRPFLDGDSDGLDREQIRVLNTICQPVRAARDVLGGHWPEHDIEYFVMLAIRRHYGCLPSARIAHLFNFLAEQLNGVIAEHQGTMVGTQRPNVKYADLAARLEASLHDSRIAEAHHSRSVSLFIECCRAAGHLQVGRRPGFIAAMSRAIDAEYLLSRLFGMTTGITGFDELFGGGLLLIDDFVQERDEWVASLAGRTILLAGRYATGKSLLALQMAVAVARKGGAAWFMPLEQTAEECLYTLEAMGAFPADGSVKVARTTFQLQEHLESGSRAGLLVFLRSIKESYEDFLALIPSHLDLIQNYPIRLLVIDPINAIARSRENVDTLRRRTLEAFEEAKKRRVNVWLNAEESPGAATRLFEQNVTDVVIRLSVEESHHHNQAYLEVTKSRLQRQQRGRHPYSIVSGRGFTIAPSSVSFADRIRQRRLQISAKSEPFGIAGFDRILGHDGITPGDVIVLVGSGGLFKTHVGLLFLHSLTAAQKRSRSRSQSTTPGVTNLLIPVRDNSAGIDLRLREPFLVQQKQEFERYGKVGICSLPVGYVQPGDILTRIESELLTARRMRAPVDRVMVDNVHYWEMACPNVRDDQTFPDTLLELFRRFGCTSLLTCAAAGAGLQRMIIDNADCVFEFERVQFNGVDRIFVRALKTRSMSHRRDTFELVLRDGRLDLVPDSEMLRVSEDGDVTSIPVRLFLHAENRMQHDYNANVAQSLRAVLGHKVEVDDESRLGRSRELLAGVAVVDELQILQLDEFQAVPGGSGDVPGLHVFPASEWRNDVWNDFDQRLRRRTRLRGGAFATVPFYENLSVLAYHPERIGGAVDAVSWQRLADQCAALERRDDGADGAGRDAVVFDFPGVTAENYNCLFFEILASRRGISRGGERCDLEAWLGERSAVDAALLMRRVTQRAHRHHLRVDQAPFGQASNRPMRSVELNPSAAVWRTWYTTLMQLMSSMAPEEARKLVVVPLPEGVSIAGEWYLGLPSYSAAPDVGLRIIRHLTTREAEFDRLKQGVGLPIRLMLYDDLPNDAPVSDEFRLSVGELKMLMATALRRSGFGCYAQMSELLGSHLKAIIEVPDGDGLERQVEGLLNGVRSKLRLMRGQKNCARCAHAGTRS